MGKPAVQLPSQDQDFIVFAGGLDLVTPPLRAKPGTLRDALNYEVGLNGGYDRIDGYERYDGQAKPSDAQYGILDVTITGSIIAGDTITGVTSGETAVVVDVITSETPNYLVVTKISGTFVAETLNVSGSPEGTITGDAVIDGGSTALLHAQYLNKSADEYRNDIAAVPGSGAILGLWMLDDVVYAWRNNVGGSAADIYESSAAGWVNVPLGLELAFTSGGTTEIAEGDVIEGLISGATATVTRVVLESGAWGDGDATGRLIFASQTGTFQAEGIDTNGSAVDTGTITGDSSAITLLTNGNYEFVSHNFGGLAGEKRAYGVDGVNYGFEFDGTTLVQIHTGMTNDAPEHIIAHKEHLFFSYEGSAQHSGAGYPYVWSPILGAAELAMGDTVTGFQVQPGSEGNAALAIFSRNKIKILYGASVASWNLVQYRDEIGAYAGSIQQVGATMMLDDRGLVNLSTSQNFGNFEHSTLSTLIQPWINQRKTKVEVSCIARDKNQYRIFFSDNYALYVTLEGAKVLGMMPIQFEHRVEKVFSLEMNDGSEVIMFGSSDGFVYEMDRGTSFDGDNIYSVLDFHFIHADSPRILKGYKGCILEAVGEGYAGFNFAYQLDYNSTERAQPADQATTLNFAATKWDNFVWDAFYWDGQTLSPSRLGMEGSGENVSIIITGDSDYDAQVKFSGALLRYTKRRLLR